MGHDAVADFLARCIDYADNSIARKRKRGDSEKVIGEWETYREFTEHALKEVESGVLDKWFDADVPTQDLQEIDMTSLDRNTRATWLSAERTSDR